MNIDTERVITEVRIRELLWDSSHDLYKDRDARQLAWQEVCREVVPHFEEMTASQKRESEKAVQQRWKTARDAYSRGKATKFQASRSEATKRKKYIYYDNMLFLEKARPTGVYSMSTPDPNPTQETEIQELWPQNDSQNVPTQELVDDPHTKRKKTCLRKRNTDSDDDIDREMLAFIKENAKMCQNDDMAFFTSLLPIIGKFSDYQKLRFRIEVLQKAMEIGQMLNIPGSLGSASMTSPTPTFIETRMTSPLTTFKGAPMSSTTVTGQPSVNHHPGNDPLGHPNIDR